jgi:hypothetical protein
MQCFGESVTTVEAVFSVWLVPKACKRSEFRVINSIVSWRSELKPGVQVSTGDQHMKNLHMN